MVGDSNIEKVIEALLFSSDKPLPLNKIKEALGMDAGVIKDALKKLEEYYDREARSFRLAEIAGGYQIVTRAEYGVWINKLQKKGADKIRGASMETLAIIVYKQPITKNEIEAIRGVNVDGVIKTLMEKNLIKIKGRKEAPGRPIIYGTTDEFLLRFGLKDLNSLPPLREFTEKDLDYHPELEDTAGSETFAEKETPISSIPKEGDNYGTEEAEAKNRQDG